MSIEAEGAARAKALRQDCAQRVRGNEARQVKGNTNHLESTLANPSK